MRAKVLPPFLLAAALAAGCSGGGADAAKPSPTVAPTTPVASPSPTGVPLTGDPLTGLAPVKGPVVGVKIDNGILARPYQRGLTQAAIVYQELVEGGQTRFLAMFEGDASREVGPIRSARESDIEILRAYGEPAIAFSGANSGVKKIFHDAARKNWLIDASYDAMPGLYRLGERRRDARNFFAVPSKLGTRSGGSQPQDIGWRFGPPAAPGIATASASVPFSGNTVMKVRYDAAKGTYVIVQGARTVRVAPANIVIQYVTTRPSRFADVTGNVTPYTVTRGRGNLVILRDGQRFVGTWARSGFGATRMLGAQGDDLLLKPGPTWVMLVPSKLAATFA